MVGVHPGIAERAGRRLARLARHVRPGIDPDETARASRRLASLTRSALSGRAFGESFGFASADLLFDLLSLDLVVGIWAFIGGIAEIVLGFGSGETAGTRTMFILGGLVSVAFGVVLFARPGIGAVTLALLFGLFSLIYGMSQIVTGAELRRTGQTLHSVLGDAA